MLSIFAKKPLAAKELNGHMTRRFSTVEKSRLLSVVIIIDNDECTRLITVDILQGTSTVHVITII
jgi:hypothetical protein